MTFLYILFAVAMFAGTVGFGFLWLHARGELRSAQRAQLAADEAASQLRSEISTLQVQVRRLSRWSKVADADDKAREILAAASLELKNAERDAILLMRTAEQQYRVQLGKAQEEAAAESAAAFASARETRARAEAVLADAQRRAESLVSDANRRARETAGSALDALSKADFYERAALAMQHKIEGYGDEYLVPATSLLDELAQDFEHKEAGQRLKFARAFTKNLIRERKASVCDYVEDSRRIGAENFIVDAFNGKVDSILSRARHDNFGTLSQEIRDAFALVNLGGRPFRDARINDAYLDARLDELKWATIAHELKREDQEEQRRLREQMREEEKARKDYERALKEAQRDEDALRQAIFKVQAEVGSATEAQRARHEAEIAELQAKLKEAEERNQRTLSMAQQTRRGHVYIISNVGSLGENIYKIGLTRRLDPLDRIWELSDASVPFDFDVHAVILTEDAPTLESKLHRVFLLNQVNKVNHRKEFFRAHLADIRKKIEELGIECSWTMTADAQEFRETQVIERKIADDPAARDAWCNRQLRIEAAQQSQAAL